jgi:hypothetical protein
MQTIDAQVHAYERNHPGRPWVGGPHRRLSASFRPTSVCPFVGVTAGGYYNRCSSSCCRRSR